MEKWRDIPGYEGIYQASNMGRIRTCEGKTTYTERHGARHWKQRILKQKIQKQKNGRQDARVNLWKNGSEKTWLVARLIGMAWCDDFDPALTINHINGDSLDNRAENLEWVSQAENIRHAFANNLVSSQIPIVLYSDREKIVFHSMSDASRYLGHSAGYISNAIKKNNRIKSINGTYYSMHNQGIFD